MTAQRPAEPWHTDQHTLPFAIDTQRAFAALYGESETAFWLDGAVDRFSFLGSGSGPWSETLEYRVGSGAVLRRRAGVVDELAGNIFDVLESRLAARVMSSNTAPSNTVPSNTVPSNTVPSNTVPLPFTSGYVGYLGYEVKADCGSPNSRRSPHPDAAWVFADRLIAVDHVAGVTYLLVSAPDDADAEPGSRWISDTASRLEALRSSPGEIAGSSVGLRRSETDLENALVRGRRRYLADVQSSLEALQAGDSYEICLTNTAVLAPPPDPLAYFSAMRRQNHGGYSSFLRFGRLVIASSSPECFLRVDATGVIESRPIKGTVARSEDHAVDARRRTELAADPKARSENLMIVDLLRNDLGRVCEIGSVTVPTLMAVETYANVHHLVSTIRGRLRAGVGPVRAMQQCFPPGSMTGAPKLRSMEIIGELEDRARGPYSGALGYLSTSGTADLAVVIRTAVIDDTEMTIGAGGAIVLDSDPAQEYAEMLLKLRTPLIELP